MEDFALVEADFQQYYHLNLLNEVPIDSDGKRTGFLRYARLFSNLPAESRIMREYDPMGGWSWNDEVQSRILAKIEAVEVALYNINRKKNAKPIEPSPQFEPDYVKRAKKNHEKREKAEKAERLKVEKAQMDAFWMARNPEVNTIGS